jgi:hypothetical protein
METELTKTIKKHLRYFRPAFASSMRVIRWAEEVETPTGYVDTARFEDYITRDDSYCALITPKTPDEAVMAKNKLFGCKIPGETYPRGECKCCVHKKSVHVMGILTTCFEVKITVSDFKSPNGHNFHGHRNYYAVPVDIYDKIRGLVPPGIGIIVYYPQSGRMAIKQECEHREITESELSRLLYAALKKWVVGRQET